jgi:hypothetical protein
MFNGIKTIFNDVHIPQGSTTSEIRRSIIKNHFNLAEMKFFLWQMLSDIHENLFRSYSD